MLEEFGDAFVHSCEIGRVIGTDRHPTYTFGEKEWFMLSRNRVLWSVVVTVVAFSGFATADAAIRSPYQRQYSVEYADSAAKPWHTSGKTYSKYTGALRESNRYRLQGSATRIYDGWKYSTPPSHVVPRTRHGGW